jgi:pyrroline-5-carboxylate reductase
MNKIGFIGAGNMASGLIGGLLNAGYEADSIKASDPSPLSPVTQSGIETFDDNQAIAAWADVIILAVKPQVLKSVCEQIAEQVSQHHNLIISIAAGIRSNNIADWLGSNTACIRVMPNTPALIGLGMSGLYANPQASQVQIDTAKNIMQTVGRVIQLENEEMIDAVTAVSGSGPAYFFLFMEAMIKAAKQQGLSEDDARSLVLQTALGAATMAIQSDVDTEELRRRVTSPGGTTERAIKTMQDGDIMQLINDAIDAATRRSIELSNELTDDN